MYDRLTKGDIEKMEREIEERKLVKRPELIEAVKEARAPLKISSITLRNARKIRMRAGSAIWRG